MVSFFSLVTLMQVGGILLAAGVVNLIIGGGMSIFWEKTPAKYILIVGVCSAFVGLIALALVAAIGGMGMFNA